MKKLVLSWYDWQSGNKKQSDFLYDCFSKGFEPNYIIDLCNLYLDNKSEFVKKYNNLINNFEILNYFS